MWRAGTEWGPSYASPVPAVIHGKRRVFVFAGGESNPPTGGLMSIDPANGRVDFSFPWRSRSYESVNASCPVVFDNKVFISASYRTGGALLEIRPDFTHRRAVDDAGVRAAFQHADLQGRLSVRVRRAERARRVARVRRRRERQGRVAQDARMGGDVRGRRPAPGGSWSGPIGDRCWPSTGSSSASASSGHLLWMDLTPKGYKEVSRARLFAARESWALPVLSRGLLYVVQNTRDFMTGARPRLLCYDLRA